MAQYLPQTPAILSNRDILDLAYKDQLAQQKMLADMVKQQSKGSKAIDADIAKQLSSLNSAQMYAPDKQAMKLYEQEMIRVLNEENLSDTNTSLYFSRLAENANNHMTTAKTMYAAAENANLDKPEQPTFYNLLNYYNTGNNPWEEDGMELDMDVQDLLNSRQQRDMIPKMQIDPATGLIVEVTDNGARPRLENPIFANPSYPISLRDMSSISPQDFSDEYRTAYSNLETEAQVRQALTQELSNNPSLARRAIRSMTDVDVSSNKTLAENAEQRWIDQTTDFLYKAPEASDTQKSKAEDASIFLNSATTEILEEELINITDIDKDTLVPTSFARAYEMAFTPRDVRVNIGSDEGTVYDNAYINTIFVTDTGDLFIKFSPIRTGGISETENLGKVVKRQEVVGDYEAIATAIDTKYGAGTFNKMIEKAIGL